MNASTSVPLTPPPPPPLPLFHQGIPAATTGELQEMPTPRSRLRRLQWVKIPAGRVADGGRNVWTDVGSRVGSPGCSARLDFAEMEELFRVADPSTSMNGVVRRQHSGSPSEDVSITDRQKNRDEVSIICRHLLESWKYNYDNVACYVQYIKWYRKYIFSFISCYELKQVEFLDLWCIVFDFFLQLNVIMLLFVFDIE